ncbi:MAG: hypothetical protein Q8O91_07385 [Candidatus Aminicenantes bacterium]|nr:hypothetical protein [Candidatus Aminicenantes bacterium]
MDMNINGTSSIQGFSETRKRERSFELSLPALVKGFDAAEREFSEQTEVSSLSAQEAVLCLQSKVMIGTKLLLCLRVPQTFFLEKRFDLCLSGTVAFVKSDVSIKSRSQLVSVKLDRNFQVQP